MMKILSNFPPKFHTEVAVGDVRAPQTGGRAYYHLVVAVSERMGHYVIFDATGEILGVASKPLYALGTSPRVGGATLPKVKVKWKKD